MPEIFMCLASLAKEEKKVSLGIGKYNQKGNHTFYTEVRNSNLSTQEHADQLAIFVALGKIERLGVKQAKLFHFSSFVKTTNAELLKKNPQIPFINQRLERLKKKNIHITFTFLIKRLIPL